MTAPSRRRRWPYTVAVGALLLCIAVALLYENPFWLIDRGVQVYLRTHRVEDHYVEVDGRRLHYLEAQPAAGGQGKPLLLVHGLGARASDWAPLIPGLSRSGYHVYALDLLGYGASAKPADGDYSLPGEEQIAVDFMHAVHLQSADIAGWSMGGWLGMLLALDHPGQVRRLLLFDSAGLYFDPDFDGSMFTPSDRAGLERLVARIEPDRPNLRIPGWAEHGMLRRMEESRWIIERSFRSMISGRSVVDFRVSQVHQPVLIVWGTEDKLTPFSQAMRLHELLPQSVLYGLRGCGHLAAAECAGAVLPVVLRFLNADPAEPPGAVIQDGRSKRQ